MNDNNGPCRTAIAYGGNQTHVYDCKGMCPECMCPCHTEVTPNTSLEGKRQHSKFCLFKSDEAPCRCPVLHEGKEPAKEWRERFDKEFDFHDCSALNGVEIKAFIERELEQALAQDRSETQKGLLGSIKQLDVYIDGTRDAYMEGYKNGMRDEKAARDAELRELVKAKKLHEAAVTTGRLREKQFYNRAIDAVLDLLK